MSRQIEQRVADAENGGLRITVDDVTDPAVTTLLTEHLAEMAEHSPAESMHALDLAALRHPGVIFWTGWDGQTLAGCAALKRLDSEHAEIKSMRTAATHQRRGVGSTLLRHLIGRSHRTRLPTSQPGNRRRRLLPARPQALRGPRLRLLPTVRRLPPRPQ
ncbi:GNAT family N-acetyltransferase [Nocardia pneumoniae]|uniref:GNAT family N-acetyltransferase n=1 Tax=Nocardia pneumoniae TaxID=228601 RepID=UPI0003012819|nr:GNAT family N-acetyltransferase [Nocardia pneumoniae]